MADSSPNCVTFERALKREKARQKRHRQGGQHQELSQRLQQHQELPLMDSMPKKKKSQVKHTEGSQVLNTLGSARPPPTAVPPEPLRPSPLHYNTPTDLPSTIEELLTQVPDYQEVPPPPQPPQEEIVVVEEKEEKPFGWNLPPRPSNWHDQPSKKGVPYAVLFGRNPTYVYDEEEEQKEEVRSPPTCPFHDLPLPQYVSNQGWAYVKCPQQPRAVFLDEKKSPEILAQLQAQKHPQLIAGTGTTEDLNPPLTCFCYEPLTLRVAQTPKNPGRLFLTCKTQQCRFFQWINEPWSPRLRNVWAQAKQTT